MDTLEVMRKSDLFHGLNDEQLKIVGGISTVCEFQPGAIICKQGTTLDKIYLIEDGLVGIILELGPLSERQVQAASKFESFGWSAVIEPHISSNTVKAIEKTKVLAFNGSELDSLCLTQYEIGSKICRAISRIVATRLHNAYVQLLGVTYQD